MNTNELTIATITLARTEAEEELLLESLQYLSRLQIPVYITDGGSNDNFLAFLCSVPNFILLQAKAGGVYNQAKNSLSAAYQHESSFIFYTEPDKKDFFKNELPRMLEEASPDQKTGIITASRSVAAFATFPAFQQMTETTINNCCKEILRQNVDYTYGPFLVNRQLIPYLNLLKEDTGWGWRPYVFGVAHRLGFTIDAFTGDFFCPPSQRDDDAAERAYRMRQLAQNIQGLVTSASVSLD